MPPVSLLNSGFGFALVQCSSIPSTAHAEHLVVCVWCCSGLYISLSLGEPSEAYGADAVILHIKSCINWCISNACP